MIDFVRATVHSLLPGIEDEAISMQMAVDGFYPEPMNLRVVLTTNIETDFAVHARMRGAFSPSENSGRYDENRMDDGFCRQRLSTDSRRLDEKIPLPVLVYLERLDNPTGPSKVYRPARKCSSD